MNRWEYISLSVIDNKPYSRNGKRLEAGWQTWAIWDYLSQLGAEGWELVGVISKDDQPSWMYLKRLMGQPGRGANE